MTNTTFSLTVFILSVVDVSSPFKTPRTKHKAISQEFMNLRIRMWNNVLSDAS